MKHIKALADPRRTQWLAEFSEQERIQMRDEWLQLRRLTEDQTSLLDYVYGQSEESKEADTPPTHHINNASSQNQSRASSEEMTEVPDFNKGSIKKDSQGRECTMLDADCQKEPLVD